MSSELIDNAKKYDGQVVDFEGEVIGDVMHRGRHVWLNLNDGRNAVSVWAEGEDARDIQFSGSYKGRGDWLVIKGIFHRACAEHGGDLDIHAQSVSVHKRGKPIPEILDPVKQRTGIMSVMILVAVWVLSRFVDKKRKQI
ncbi:MAG: DNA-binding protein [Candidatus Omnitrophica bacterium]|nr:DNA-binding protein [Candidatus Omnitrophota bacterium]